MVAEGAGSQPAWGGPGWGLGSCFLPRPLSAALLPQGRNQPAGWAPTTRARQCGPSIRTARSPGPRRAHVGRRRRGSPRRGPAPAPTDDLFARKLRQPARPHDAAHLRAQADPGPACAQRQRCRRGPGLRHGQPSCPSAHSHEDASRPAAPPARFFDPLALLRLPAEGRSLSSHRCLSRAASPTRRAGAAL